MRDRLYKVSICMGDDGAMQSAVCDCARGMYKCSHAAALAIFAMWQISSTDVECQWRKPGTSKVVQPVSQLYQQQEETYNPLARDIATQDVDWFRSALRGTQCGMAWLLSPEPEPQPQHQAIVTVPELVKEHGGRGLEAILASMRLTRDRRTADKSPVAVTQTGQVDSQQFWCCAEVGTFIHSMRVPHEEGAWGLQFRRSHGCQLGSCK
ncbi:uncharacterized protein LOC117555703 isoform X2 [Gymnodraco acuticeps]|uniref:Uncharacterized protein LOC117555703 isoform X2 n=1 Tax=Gymnodraco acuticeps TaxID=8218 RepID=A0A6P8VLP1_GYMAC|nr:uncharacterized protein LOC117555703 isoform X2 [Gymnodraco acuticeps]